MALQQLKVHEIVKQAVSKTVDIPEFQRPFVWDPEQVKLLAESLYRDYPVGSFLLWDSADYQEAKTAEGSQATLWIVDGQQRTTALCLLLGQKPYWWDGTNDWNKALAKYDVMVNLLPDHGEDRLEFALRNPVREKDPRWVSVRRIVANEKVEALTPIAQEIVSSIAKDPAEMMSLFGVVHGRLQRVWQIRERDIPVVRINHEIEDVAEIFARLNQAGTRVREADVILALAAVRNPGWVRTDYLPFCNDLESRGWSLDAGILIRTITGIAVGRARLLEVPKSLWSPSELIGAWNKCKAIVNEVILQLAQFGVLSPDLLPSTNSLIPLFVLHHRWKGRPGYEFKRALYWFLLANRDGRYSGSAVTSLNEDVRTITEATSFDEALQALLKRLRVSPQIDASEFLNHYARAGNRFLRLMLYLVLFHRGAKDWVDGTRLGYDKTGSPVTSGFQPQWHHIYPRAVLAGKVKDDDINALANITVMNEGTNMRKLGAKEPWRYIRDCNIGPAELIGHLIPSRFVQAAYTPEAKSVWSVGAYTDFVLERSQLLAQASNEFLNSLLS